MTPEEWAERRRDPLVVMAALYIDQAYPAGGPAGELIPHVLQGEWTWGAIPGVIQEFARSYGMGPLDVLPARERALAELDPDRG